MGDPDKTDAQRETSNTTRNTIKNAGSILETTLLRLEKSMADLNQNMDNSVSVMNKNIDDKVVILNKTIDDKMDGLREDIMSELITKVQNNETNIATNTNKIELLQTTVNKLENLIESNSKANDLIVKGIPILSNEKNP
jgi:tRNA U34 5-carboxymethylaminomethyl modifying GTPase MnmE/TrmE